MSRLAESHTVTTQNNLVRLSDYAAGIFEIIPSKKGIKKAIKKGWVLIDDKVAYTADYVKEGQVINLLVPEDYRPNYELPVPVLFQDDHLAVVLKPAGLLTNGNKFKTLENTLPFVLQPSQQADALFRPELAHRLDYPTSGIMLVGKTRSSLTALKKQFENKTIQKTYWAITVGEMPKDGTVHEPIDGKEATTAFNVIDRQVSGKYGFFNLVACVPLTGRTHQIRRHLKHIGFPILGDQIYAPKNLLDMKKGLYLHAASITFAHPILHNTMYFKTDIPKKFLKHLKR